LIIQNRDGSLVHEPERNRYGKQEQKNYYADLPVALLDEQSSLIDRIISFAFDTLGAMRLEVRVRETE
jgi:hypothetical protein